MYDTQQWEVMPLLCMVTGFMLYEVLFNDGCTYARHAVYSDPAQAENKMNELNNAA